MRIYPPTKDRRDIGKVEFTAEKVMAARELHSCCISVEAALERDAGPTRSNQTGKVSTGWKFWRRQS
jgi:hypothetical protein